MTGKRMIRPVIRGDEVVVQGPLEQLVWGGLSACAENLDICCVL